MNERVAAVAAQMKWKPGDVETIRHNYAVIKDALAEVEAERGGVRALLQANQQLCKHPNSKSYSDPRDPGGWDCPDCGASR